MTSIISNVINNIMLHEDIDQKTIDIVKYYWGIEENQNHTLEECGINFNITKEGARQKIAKFISIANNTILHNKHVYNDIKYIRDLIKKHTPISESRLKSILFENKVISKEDHSINWIIPVTNLYGRHHHFIKEKINNHIFISHISYIISKNIPSHGLKKMRSDGAIEKGKISLISIPRENMDFYIDREWIIVAEPAKMIKSEIIKEIVSNGTIDLHKFVKKAWGSIDKRVIFHNVTIETKEKFIMDVAKACQGYEEIGEDWFWIRGVGRNRLITNIYKVISIHKQINMRDMMSEILYSTDIEYLPPIHSYERMFKDNPDINIKEVKGEIIAINKQVKKEEQLSESEIKLYDIIKETGSIRYSDLIKKAKEMNLSSHQLLVKLNTSPLFKKKKRGIYSL